MPSAGRLQPFFPSSPEAKQAPALLIFPHAGGSALSFAPLARALRADCEVLVAEVPGRGESHKEAAPASLVDFARSLAPEISTWMNSLGRPVVFFGHSMGALVAYETCLALSGPLPAKLVVSACAAPGLRQGPDIARKGSELSEEELLQFMAAYGAIPPALSSAAARSYFLPIFAADLRLIESYQPSSEKLAVAIHAISATRDPVAKASDIKEWEKLTKKAFSHESVEGGHFFPLDSTELTKSVIKNVSIVP